MGGGEVLYSLAGPIDQRVELEEIALPVCGYQSGLAAIRRLVGAQPGNPALRTCERPFERLNFSHVAAGDTRLLGMIEAVDALGRNKLLKRRLLRIDRPDAASIAPFGLFPGRISFRKQPAGVERDHVDIESSFTDVMQDDLVLQPEAGRENDRSVECV